MSKNVVFSYGGNSATLPMPKYGYTSKINMALNISQCPYGGSIKSWDNGIAYDHRICNAKWILTQSEMDDLNTFLENVNGGRVNTFTGTIDADSGLYWFGPDLYGEGVFTLDEVNNGRSARLLRPHNRYEFSGEFLMVSASSYTPPSITPMGSTTIGTVTGVHFIYNIEPMYNKGWRTDVSLGGGAVEFDTGSENKYTDIRFSVDVNQSIASNLVYYLVNTARGNSFNITTETGTYLFGAENGSSGTYTVQLKNNIIEVTHGSPDRFKITLDVHLVEVA